MRAAAAGVALLLCLTGCSLPLPKGVKSVGTVEGAQPARDALQVIPPGPAAGQTPEQAVTGFLNAEASSDDDHAIARTFLTPEEARSWRATGGTFVYDLDGLQLPPAEVSGDEATATVTARVTGQVGADGTYLARDDDVRETYRLRRVDGEWRLSDVPDGLRLTAADRDRAFRASDVYFVATTTPGASRHLVPDRVFLTAATDPVQVLVRRVLAGPSERLSPSVLAAPSLRATAVSEDGAGVVTVDLAAARLSELQLQDLSAQLVWTLRSQGPAFTGLRLRMAGKALRPAGMPEVQDDGAWESYAPDRLGPTPPYYFVVGRRLRSSAVLPATTATAGDPGQGGAVGVDAVAVTPDRTQVALLDGTGTEQVTVRTGPLRGPTYRTAVSAPGLSSPTWGSGEQGLFLLQRSSQVVLLPPGATALTTVPLQGRPPGRLNDLAVSRDGSRLAVAVDDRLYVGQLTRTAGRVSVDGLLPVAPQLRVQSLAWSTGTELVVAARTGAGPAQVLRVAVDGSVVTALNTGGLRPDEVAAAPGRVLFRSDGVLWLLDSRAPVRLQGGTEPVYPG